MPAPKIPKINFNSYKSKSKPMAKPAKKSKYTPQNASLQKIASDLIPKALNVKLSSTIDYETVTIPIQSSGGAREVWLGNAMVPRCGTGAFGGQVVTSGDNSGVKTPANNNKMPAGAQQYADFFKSYTCYGSLLDVEVVNTGNQPIECIMFPVPGTVAVSELDSYSSEELLSYPGVQKYVIGLGSGGTNHRRLKAFCSTKSILGVKDIADNDNLVGLVLPTSATVPSNYWFWYVRFLTLDPSTASAASMIFKITNYFKLIDRKFIPTGNVSGL